MSTARTGNTRRCNTRRRNSRKGIARTGQAETVLAVPPDAVWRVAADVTRTGQWSHECREVTWLRGATGPVPGARFRGRNRRGLLRWTRISEITAVEAPREIAWRTVRSVRYPDSTDWRITLEPTAGGTRVRLTYQVIALPRWFDWIISRAVPAHGDRNAALGEDLHRRGEVVGREVALPSARI